jgi:hypothetical protein
MRHDHWPQILDVAPGIGILQHGDSGNASQQLVREASSLLEALFHDNERPPGAKLHGVILAFGFRSILCIVSRSVNSVC